MFVVPAFEIHGGVGGLFDLGPPSCALKVKHLVLEAACSRAHGGPTEKTDTGHGSF